MATPPAAGWTGRSRGGRCSVWVFHAAVLLLPIVGLVGAWLGSWVIAAAFLAVGGRRQFGIITYWRRHRPRMSRWTCAMTLWRHYASFGRILCDRMLFFLRPERYRLSHAGIEAPIAMMARGQGFIFISAHLGNWEVAPLLLRRGLDEAGARAPKAVHVVMVRNEHPAVQRFADSRLRAGPVQAIDPREPVAAAVAVSGAIGRGEVVCMLGDRVMGDQPFVVVPFLGRLAKVPVGPFQTALVTGAPIVPAFLVKTGWRGYHLQIDAPWFVRAASRADRRRAIEAAARRWARRLELEVRRRPFQWHNFFPYFVDAAGGPADLHRPATDQGPPPPPG